MILTAAIVSANQLDDLVDDAEILEILHTAEIWEADKMWPICIALAAGPNGWQRLPGSPITEPVGFTPVFRADADELADFAARLTDNVSQIEQRFDAGQFGDEPPSPAPDETDRQWCSERAAAFTAMIRNAAPNQALLWVIE